MAVDIGNILDIVSNRILCIWDNSANLDCSRFRIIRLGATQTVSDKPNNLLLYYKT